MDFIDEFWCWSEIIFAVIFGFWWQTALHNYLWSGSHDSDQTPFILNEMQAQAIALYNTNID